MAFSNPVDLFAELSDNCVCSPDTGGTWAIVSAPLSPTFNICINDGGGFANESVTSLPHNLGGGNNEYIVIDFTGVECATPTDYSGEWVLTYTVETPGCIRSSTLTITVGGGTAEVTFERSPEICWYEIYTENPDTPGSKVAKLQMNFDYMTPNFSLRHKVERKQFDGCALAVTTLENTLHSNIFDFTTAEVPTTTFHEGWGFLGPGIYLYHAVTIDTSAWSDGAEIQSFTVYDSAGAGTDYDLDLTGAIFIPGDEYNYADDLEVELNSQLLAAGCTLGNAWLEVTGIANTSVTISFLCANNSTDWWGIDKNDWEVQYIAISGGPLQVNTFCTFSQRVLDRSGFMFYTYDVTGCDCYENSSTCTIMVVPAICGQANGYENIYNLASCNYDVLTLKASLPEVIDSTQLCAA